MSTIKTNAVQIGQSVTATNNFTFYQPTTPDGTVRIGNGNVGAATDRITIDSSGNVSPGVTNTQTLGAVGDVWSNVHATTFTGTTGTFSGNIQSASQNGGQLAGLRNKIINGDMAIWQRGTAAITSAANGAYSADRFTFRSSYTGGTTTITQSTGPNQTLRYSTRFTHATATATVVTAQYYAMRQLIEKSVARGFANASNVTVSFWYRSNRTGAHACVFDAGLTGVGFTGTTTAGSSTFTVNVADTWEFESLTFPLAITGNGTNADNLVGALLTIGFADATLSTFSSISVGDYFDVTGVQLEVGPVATPFETRPYGMELALCQRYYYEFGTFHVGMYSTTNAQGDQAYPVIMRTTTPAFTFTDSAGTAGQVTIYNGAVVNTTISAGSLTAGANRLIIDANTTTGGATTWLRAYNCKISAEL
jgi:hypothetical protein